FSNGLRRNLTLPLFHELRIHIGSRLNVVPGKELVRAGNDSAEAESAGRVRYRRAIVHYTIPPPVFLWNQNHGCARYRLLVLVVQRDSIDRRGGRTEHDLQRCDLAGAFEAEVKHIAVSAVRGFHIETLRQVEQFDIIDACSHVLDFEVAILLNAGSALAASAKPSARGRSRTLMPVISRAVLSFSRTLPVTLTRGAKRTSTPSTSLSYTPTSQ